MVLEAGYIYCKRYNLNFETFIDVFMSEEFNSSEGSEFNNICIDLRSYQYINSYKLIEITEAEYDMCVCKFNDDK